jgi:hypothetical protein
MEHRQALTGHAGITTPAEALGKRHGPPVIPHINRLDRQRGAIPAAGNPLLSAFIPGMSLVA